MDFSAVDTELKTGLPFLSVCANVFPMVRIVKIRIAIFFIVMCPWCRFFIIGGNV